MDARTVTAYAWPATAAVLTRLNTRRCDADAQRGTGTGACDRPLDERGACDRQSAHL